MKVNIALDAMAGDRGSDALVSGALQAVDNDADVKVTLIGDESLLTAALARYGRTTDSSIEIVHASEVVGMDESPMSAIRKKKDSSIVIAFALAKKRQIDAVVSAGNSGATMAAAIRSLGRLKNVLRPGIASIFPTLKGPVVMMDAGANVDCRPQNLVQFAIMATAFAEISLGVDNPRIGVLSNGAEGGKGNSLVKKTHELLSQSSLNFIGNVEGSDTFTGDVDVITCDGFVGNVCLKITEGFAEAIFSMLKDEISKTIKAKLGYLLARGAFANFKKRIDYAEYGGAPLLGLNGNAIICHGRSNATAIKNAIHVAADLVRSKVNDRILKLLAGSETLIQLETSNGTDSAGSGAKQ